MSVTLIMIIVTMMIMMMITMMMMIMMTMMMMMMMTMVICEAQQGSGQAGVMAVLSSSPNSTSSHPHPVVFPPYPRPSHPHLPLRVCNCVYENLRQISQINLVTFCNT